jgi:hypothetical protein
MGLPRWATLFIVLMTLLLSGCAVPASSLVVVSYSEPTTRQAISAAAIEKSSVRTALFKDSPTNYGVSASPATSKPVVNVGPGVTRPEVDVNDPWSIVLSRVRVQDPQRGLFEGGINMAVLLRVQSGERNEIDGKWVLAYVQEDVEVPSELNFDNLLVWSGLTPKTVVIDLQLVKLNKADKEKMAGYLSVASLVAGAIPTYGAAAAALVKAGEAINDARRNYTVLLAYSAGFTPVHSLRYAAYVLLPQGIANERAPELWYDLRQPERVRSSRDPLTANWVVLRIIKGSSRTFEYGRAESLEKVREIADQWIATQNPTIPLDKLRDAVKNLVSSAEAARIVSRTDFKNRSSILATLTSVKVRQADPNQGLRLGDEDYNRILQIVGSYLPQDVLPQAGASIDAWIDATKKLDGYHFDADQERWVKN